MSFVISDSSNIGYVYDFETNCHTDFKSFKGQNPFKIGKMTPTSGTGASQDATFPTGQF